MQKNWQIWVDTGGTFTDCLAVDPNGEIKRCKVLSNSSLRGTISKQLNGNTFQIHENWDAPEDFIKNFSFRLLTNSHPDLLVQSYDPENHTLKISPSEPISVKSGQSFEVISPFESPILAARLVTKTAFGKSLPPVKMRLGTTKGTNALLERKGVPVAFFVTRGFGDLILIGTQQRPDLFTLDIQKPQQLYKSVAEVEERLDSDGNEIILFDAPDFEKKAKTLFGQGIKSAAICFLHSYKNPDLEHQARKILEKIGYWHISCSSDLAPFIKILPRAETSIANAYLAPVIDKYLEAVYGEITDGSLHIMTSAGGLVGIDSYRAKDSLLSGPAGGVVGVAKSGEASGFQQLISFDMGGTSTDVSRYDGDFEYQFEHIVGDAHLVAPALSIETVAAGGGSVCSYDGFKLSVGPESAGAFPGPASYGAGGPLTLTDVNLLLGHLDTSRFGIPVDKDPALKQLQTVVEQIEQKNREAVNDEEILTGFLDIANERMADAIRKISLRKGYDPHKYTMVAFGGAGGQHACGVADRLGIKTILLPANAGLLSAFGLGKAVIERFSELQILKTLNDFLPDFDSVVDVLCNEAVKKVMDEGITHDEIIIRRIIVNMRFQGQESTLPIDVQKNEKDKLTRWFRDRYTSVYGHWTTNKNIEVESIRIVASSTPEPVEKPSEKAHTYSPKSHHTIQSYFQNEWMNIPVYLREELNEGAQINGPALILDRYSTTVVDPNWNANVDHTYSLILQKVEENVQKLTSENPEAVNLELFTNRFSAIASEMGEMLQRTALSVNVKERLDFSCAVLDANGDLVVNAPHIPVHLGAMGICVKKLKESILFEPGDVIITNHPGFGGSHLPDITIVTPVFLDEEQLVGFTASRAHHAEIGGSRPGSMPPQAKTLDEEGIVIPPTYLIKRHEPQWEAIRKIFTDSKYPTRALDDNMADLNAAIAANNRGSESLIRLCKQETAERVHYYMNRLKFYAEERMRATLKQIPDGLYKAAELLDDGTPLQTTIHIRGDEAIIDFTGSGAQHPGNLNATPAIVNSVVIYVLRLLVDEPLPLNEGLMKPVMLHIPPGILNPDFNDVPEKCPAVVGGNTETSQRLVDTLLKAFKKSACSQGTMNNVLFGNDSFGYYETVCGGCGAGPDFDGASAVHQHMTNTRITDPEIMEFRYPVRLEKFAIRDQSGGKGKHQGGDGTIRKITFSEPVSLSVLTQHRITAPYGMEDGEAGKCGEQFVIRKNGERVDLQSIDGCEMEPGDTFTLLTPGGGGYGKLEE